MTLRLNSSGGGYVEQDAPNIAGNYSLTLPTSAGSADQVLVTNGSGTLSWESRMTAAGPAFSAYADANQSLANNTQVKLTFNVEEFDTASCYDSTTNYRFTPNVAGYYQFTACMNINPSSGVVFTSFFKNGSQFKRGSQIPSGSVQPNSTALIYLNGSTDYVEAYGFQNSGSSTSTNNGQHQVYFQGFLARPA